jgi:hypothetical protein
MSTTIPEFDHNLVLPPHKGDPRVPADISPYPCFSLDLVHRFATSPERMVILRGFLEFRQRLRSHGLTNGYQWLDGSFLEDIEQRENRAPNDLDVLTLYWGYDFAFLKQLIASFPEFSDRDLAKKNFSLDHFGLDVGYAPQVTVEHMRYWLQLFTHNRDSVWKGMLKIDLDTEQNDIDALDYLKNTTP